MVEIATRRSTGVSGARRVARCAVGLGGPPKRVGRPSTPVRSPRACPRRGGASGAAVSTVERVDVRAQRAEALDRPRHRRAGDHIVVALQRPSARQHGLDGLQRAADRLPTACTGCASLARAVVRLARRCTAQELARGRCPHERTCPSTKRHGRLGVSDGGFGTASGEPWRRIGGRHVAAHPRRVPVDRRTGIASRRWTVAAGIAGVAASRLPKVPESVGRRCAALRYATAHQSRD